MNNKRCVIIGASPDTNIEIIKKYIREDDFIVCADGGYTYAEQLGIVPAIVTGDFDSGTVPKNKNIHVTKLPVRKDDTDTVSVVNECIKLGFDEFVMFGMTGGRFDHTLANISVLYHLAKLGKKAEIIDENKILKVLCTGEERLTGFKGCGFGIFPIFCESVTLSLSGFEYELDCKPLYADHPVGVSNTIISDDAAVTVYAAQGTQKYLPSPAALITIYY